MVADDNPDCWEVEAIKDFESKKNSTKYVSLDSLR